MESLSIAELASYFAPKTPLMEAHREALSRTQAAQQEAAQSARQGIENHIEQIERQAGTRLGLNLDVMA